MDISEINLSEIDPVNEICVNPVSSHIVVKPENDSSRKSQQYWTGQETEYMLSLYEENIKEVGPSKRFRIKKIMWMHIASIMVEKFNRDFTGAQIENRYKSMCRKKRNASNKQAKFTSHYDHEYEQFIDMNDSISQDDEEEEIFSDDRKNIKKIEFTPTNDYYNNSNSNHIAAGTSSSPPPPFLFGASNENVILKYMQQQKEIFKEQEESKQKRHDEKMTVLKGIGESLQRLLERKRKYSG